MYINNSQVLKNIEIDFNVDYLVEYNNKLFKRKEKEGTNGKNDSNEQDFNNSESKKSELDDDKQVDSKVPDTTPGEEEEEGDDSTKNSKKDDQESKDDKSDKSSESSTSHKDNSETINNKTTKVEETKLAYHPTKTVSKVGKPSDSAPTSRAVDPLIEVNNNSNTSSNPVTTIDNASNTNKGSGSVIGITGVVFSLLALIVIGSVLYIYRKKIQSMITKYKNEEDSENDNKTLTMYQDNSENDISKSLSFEKDSIEKVEDNNVSYTDLIKKDIKHRTIEIYQSDILASPKLAALASPDLSRSASRISRLEVADLKRSPSRGRRLENELLSPTMAERQDIDLIRSPSLAERQGYDLNRRPSRAERQGYDLNRRTSRADRQGYDLNRRSSRANRSRSRSGRDAELLQRSTSILRNQNSDLSCITPRMRNQTPDLSYVTPRMRSQSPDMGYTSPRMRSQSPEMGYISPRMQNPSIELIRTSSKSSSKRERKPNEENATRKPNEENGTPKNTLSSYSPSLDFISSFYKDDSSIDEDSNTLKMSFNSKDLDNTTLYSNFTDKSDALLMNNINKKEIEPATLSRIHNINDIKSTPRFNSLNRPSN